MDNNSATSHPDPDPDPQTEHVLDVCAETPAMTVHIIVFMLAGGCPCYIQGTEQNNVNKLGGVALKAVIYIRRLSGHGIAR